MAEIQNPRPGTIVVRVIDDLRDRSGNDVPIFKARISIKKMGETEPIIKGETDSNGDYITPIEHGTYTVEADAFGNKPQKSIKVDPDCSPTVELRIPVNLKLVSSIVKGDCSSPSESCTEVTSGTVLKYEATHSAKVQTRTRWVRNQGLLFDPLDKPNGSTIYFNTASAVGSTTVTVTISEIGSAEESRSETTEVLPVRVTAIDGNVAVTMRRTATVPTNDLPLWVVIKRSTDALAFPNYSRFMDIVLCGQPLRDGENGKFTEGQNKFDLLKKKRFLPFTDVDAYRLLKAATEAFVMVNCGVDLVKSFLADSPFTDLDVTEVINRVGINLDTDQLRDFWRSYLRKVNGDSDVTLPYLALIREKLKDSQLKDVVFADDLDVQLPRECFGIIRSKLTNPCLLELIWSYWHEEGMMVQTMNAVTLRFQNIRTAKPGRDPLANLEIDPLRPLNNLLWGQIQDEQHRLSVARRAYEYDHHYGITLYGKALPHFRPADSRSKFLEAFHNLLHLASIFFKEDDDTTMIADGFPMLNALKEVHLVLSEGAHNQFGDLPSTARIEMMMQEWLLARPEFREFLPTRIMVAYPEAWMDRVDAMKKLQGWTDTSILHFRNLGVFGEQILLSIRYGSWSEVNNPVQAANWARFWRSEIQGYVHAYRAGTSVDLTSDIADIREATQRFLPPSVHLRNRLESQVHLQAR